MLFAGLKFQAAITAADMLQSDNRGAGLAQGRHELRDDRGIESTFLPDSSQWNLYRLWRQQISENNMSGRQFFNRLADYGDAKASRDQSEGTSRPVCFPHNAWSEP